MAKTGIYMAQNRTSSYIYVCRKNYPKVRKKGWKKREGNQEKSQGIFAHKMEVVLRDLREHIMKRY